MVLHRCRRALTHSASEGSDRETHAWLTDEQGESAPGDLTSILDLLSSHTQRSGRAAR
jgi:hypothetical protein